jgi:hypothetical protein
VLDPRRTELPERGDEFRRFFVGEAHRLAADLARDARTQQRDGSQLLLPSPDESSLICSGICTRK